MRPMPSIARMETRPAPRPTDGLSRSSSHRPQAMITAKLPMAVSFASMLLYPVLTAGLVIASRTVNQGGDARFSQLFAGFKHRVGALIGVGAIYFAATVVIVFVVSLITGVGVLTMFGVGATPESM